MTEPPLRIVETQITDKDGVRYWRIRWRDRSGEAVTSLYLDDGYQERIAPRLREMWTLEEIYALEE